MGWREARDALFAPRPTAPPAVEERSTYRVPSPEPASYGGGFVPPITPSTAAQSVAIRSTEDLIASLASELPINVYTGRGRDRRQLTTPGNLEDPGGDGTGREDWGYRLMISWLSAGNAFGNVIDRAVNARMLTADLFSADQVTPRIVDGKPEWFVNGQQVPTGSLVHWRVNPLPGRLLGLSPIEYHAATIGVSLATTRFGRAWFADGAHSSVILSHEGDLDPEQTAIAKARYTATMGTGEPVVLAGKWSAEAIQVSPEESQFLQTQGMSEAQCARIFGPGFAEILGYETGSKMTYGNVVDRRQDLLVLGMNKWFRRFERVLSQFLPRPQWVELNRDAMLESSTIQRYAAHASALNAGWKTINEVREHENYPAVPWGNEPKPMTSSGVPAPTPEAEQEAPDANAPGA